MDKDLEKMLKDLKDVLGKFVSDNGDKMTDLIQERISGAFKQPAEISIKKYEDGRAETHVEGTVLATLITLAGLENTILEKYSVPSGLWEMVKQAVGTKEVE